jgi:hypothetical protein
LPKAIPASPLLPIERDVDLDGVQRVVADVTLSVGRHVSPDRLVLEPSFSLDDVGSVSRVYALDFSIAAFALPSWA